MKERFRKLVDRIKVVDGEKVANGALAFAISSVLFVTFGGAAMRYRELNKDIRENLAPYALFSGHEEAHFARAVEVINRDINNDGKYECILRFKEDAIWKELLLQYDPNKNYPVTRPYTLSLKSLE